MGIFDHTRFKVMSQAQHPYKHDVSEFFYSNAAVPGTSNLEDILNYLISVIYPNHIGSYATLAAATAANPTPATNDYVVVLDDGDGRAAGYVYRSIEGVSAWKKFYDVDWTTESILGETINRTQYMYVHKYGMTDSDDAGSAIGGIYAGQRIYGGVLTGQNLTFNANSFNTTGYVQSDNSIRPTADGTLDLGTTALKWSTLHSGTVKAGTLTATSGSVTDSSGAISFGALNLSTSGTLASGALSVTGAATVSTTLTVNSGGSALLIATGSITSATGAISFDNENLLTTGTLASGVLTISADLILGVGSITSVSGAISFSNENLSTTGTLSAGVTTVTQLDAGNIRILGNTISSTNAGGNIILAPDAAGILDVQRSMTTISQTVTGLLVVTGYVQSDNIRMDGNTISTLNTNGNLLLTPDGSGVVQSSSSITPSADNTKDLGVGGGRFRTLYLGTSIHDGTTSISSATLQSLRDINTGIGAGMTLFWDGSKWVGSLPDSEVDHGTISGLSDDDHTQYALLAGRSGGQTLTGGTLTTQSLTLRPNSANTTTGSIVHVGTLAADADNTRDIGAAATSFKDIYTKGQFYGFRIENVATIAAATASASAIGRLVYTIDETKAYVDQGGTWKVLGVSKFISDTVWNGTDTTKTVTVSASVADARRCIWQLTDNANDFDRIEGSIKAISATQVTLTVSVPLPAGSYRLIGIE